MSLNIEIGGQRNLPNYINLGVRDSNFNIITDELPFDDNSVDYIYWSHVIEHISPAHIEDVLVKFYKKLKPGGCLRTVCPDLEQIVEAYITKDINAMETKLFGTTPEHYKKMGIGGCFISKFCSVHKVSADADENLLFSKDGIKYGSLSHLAGYDFEMLNLLLRHIGFKSVVKTELEQIDTHGDEGQLCVNCYK